MQVRVRIQPSIPIVTHRTLALSASQCATPVSVAASFFAFWRLGSDIDGSVPFAIAGGLFSHWQVWLAIAVLVHVVGPVLSRYGKGGGAMP